MNILVTGGLGFIGSNFILFTLKNYPKIKITNVDACLTGSNLMNLNEIKNSKKYKFVKSNINNQKVINQLVSKNDLIINFAAESHVDRSISNPRPFIDSNINGTHTILESMNDVVFAMLLSTNDSAAKLITISDFEINFSIKVISVIFPLTN